VVAGSNSNPRDLVNHMYTLMKCERKKLGRPAPGSSYAYDQIEVAQYADFDGAIAASDAANLAHKSRYYVMNGSGREYYNGTWIR
jgi:hypothetical protein